MDLNTVKKYLELAAEEAEGIRREVWEDFASSTSQSNSERRRKYFRNKNKLDKIDAVCNAIDEAKEVIKDAEKK